MATVSEIYFPSRTVMANLTHMFHTMRDNAAKRKVYRDTVRELNALSGRDLADLGIYRGAITSIAMEAAYGRKSR
ncbi:MAG: DUF1127 domain-containing protein [Planktomarina sp.]